MLKLLTVLSLSLALSLGAESSSSESTSSESSSSESSSSESSSSESSSESSSGETTTSTYSNYFLSTLTTVSNTSVYFAYAVDKCTLYGFSSTYIKATCTGTDRLDVTYYSDSACTTSTGVTKTYNSTTSSSLFRCGGTSSYAQVNFGFSASTCLYQFYSALDACTTYGTGSYAYLYSSISCTATDTGALSLYTASGCSSTAYKTFGLNSSCSYQFPLSSYSVYASISDCSAATSTATTTASSVSTTTTSSSMSTTASSAGNMIDVRNIFGFLIIVFAMIFNL